LLQEYDIPFPRLIAYLLFEQDEGLSLFWHSELDDVEDLDEVNLTPLSTFIEELEFCYYDPEDETWETTTEPFRDENGQFPLPDFLRMRFRHGEIELSRTVFLPPANQNVPRF
jgi:hypothetical protein